MGGGLVLIGENSSGFNNDISSSLTPWDLVRVPEDEQEI